MDLLKAIDRLAEILNSSDIREIKVKDGGSSIFMTKNDTSKVTSVISSSPVSNNVVPEASVSSANDTFSTKKSSDSVVEEISGEEVKSPMVGTFYAAPSPGAEPYVKEGKEFKKGDVLCIIEAMKIMNKIEAEKDGKIVKILVRDGEHVQYDQPLFIIE
ncbi:MAG: acetyl-CoA carboxylase biotin carboxyl carrier protein [Francisella sp.]